MKVRFTKSGHRFVVTENSCKVYRRVDEKGFSSEYAVTPQKRSALIRKFSADIESARESIL